MRLLDYGKIESVEYIWRKKNTTKTLHSGRYNWPHFMGHFRLISGELAWPRVTCVSALRESDQAREEGNQREVEEEVWHKPYYPRD